MTTTTTIFIIQLGENTILRKTIFSDVSISPDTILLMGIVTMKLESESFNLMPADNPQQPRKMLRFIPESTLKDSELFFLKEELLKNDWMENV